MYESTPLPHKIHMLAHIIQKRASSILHEKGNIAFNSFIILHKLANHGNLNQQFLSETMQISTAAISKRIKFLCEKNLVEVTTNAKNRREHIVGITAQGRETFENLTNKLMKEFDESITAFQEKEEFEKLINRLLEIMCEDNYDRQTG